MDYEKLLRGIAAENHKTRAEFGTLSARVIASTLNGNEEELSDVINDLARRDAGDLEESLHGQDEGQQLGGSAGNAEPQSEHTGTTEESGSGI